MSRTAYCSGLTGMRIKYGGKSQKGYPMGQYELLLFLVDCFEKLEILYFFSNHRFHKKRHSHLITVIGLNSGVVLIYPLQ
jgi:hypothetical protein